MTIDVETLKLMIAEDELGLLKTREKRVAPTRDQRLLASFEEILEFVRTNGREPTFDTTDVTEIKLHARLDALRSDEEQRAELVDADDLGLLREPEPPESLAEAIADDPLGLLADAAEGIFDLRHVPKTPAAQPDRVAQRTPCDDFEQFEPLFQQCHAELRAGRRKVVQFRNEQEIREGAFYVHRGVLTYVAEKGDLYAEHGRLNARLRCIFDNGTEADLLLRSFASQLYRFGRQVTDPEDLTNEALEEQLGGGQQGYVYVLRSLSEDPQVTAIPDLYKIGSTTTTVAERTSGARSHATFLGADVEEVAVYVLPAAIAGPVEKLLHRFFAAARIDAWFERDGLTTADVTEWFSVPLALIDQAIELLQAEALGSYEFVPELREIRLAGSVAADNAAS